MRMMRMVMMSMRIIIFMILIVFNFNCSLRSILLTDNEVITMSRGSTAKQREAIKSFSFIIFLIIIPFIIFIISMFLSFSFSLSFSLSYFHNFHQSLLSFYNRDDKIFALHYNCAPLVPSLSHTHIHTHLYL